MKTRRTTMFVLLLGLLSQTTLRAQEEPLLTIACLSDCHSERSLIDQEDLSMIKLRGSFEQTLKRIKKEENIDVMVLGGDCTSDATISQQNWKRVRELLAGATRGAFPDEKPTPVLYATGNHDYEVANWDRLPKPYNAGDYYTFPMREDVGPLDFDDAFYEEAPNGSLGQMTLLAAYHYKVKGFDFVVLNCGKNYFASAWDYTYSEESVQWVADKLAQIYAAQPDKTVFFALHVPFSDSNSISSSKKGIFVSPGERLLKQTLSKYPHLIMLYGHDHGRNTGYLRRRTSQRVTHYDKQGHVIATTDATHVDGATQDPENDDNQFYLRNEGTQMFLGLDSYNLTATAARTAVTFTSLGNNAFSADVEVPNSQSSKFLHVGTSGRFSGGDPSNMYLYEVTSDADGIEATRVARPEGKKTYLLVTQYSGKWYALRGELYSAGSAEQRMEGTPVTMSSNRQTLTVATDKTLEWTFQSLLTEPDTRTHWYLQSAKDQRYVGFNTVNLTTTDYPTLVTLDMQSDVTKQFSVHIAGCGSEATGNYIVSSTDGRFSCSTDRNPIWIY
ncbi:MAG: metallophosphoesterase, partial [Bacteroidaceae bacterium]|nr:metallophosphoesterase [Bacteroidaceae bacterium]